MMYLTWHLFSLNLVKFLRLPIQSETSHKKIKKGDVPFWLVTRETFAKLIGNRRVVWTNQFPRLFWPGFINGGHVSTG